MTQPDLTITAAGRRAGKTTTLLDVAMANARRGQVVWFTSSTYSMAVNAFRLATELLLETDTDTGAVIQHGPKNFAIEYPSKGVVRFLWPGYPVFAARGDAEPEVRIYDDSGPGADIRFSFSERHRRAQEGIN